jgi:hypothetical protein
MYKEIGQGFGRLFMHRKGLLYADVHLIKEIIFEIQIKKIDRDVHIFLNIVFSLIILNIQGG